jgi:phage tail sheath gpL-like
MPASTGALGVPANNRIPAVFLSISFGASPNGSSGGPLKCLLLGFKTSAGTGTADTTIYQLNNGLTDAQTYAGLNSMAYLMAKAAYTLAPTASVYLGFPAEPSGAKATTTLSIGSAISQPSTGSGNVTVTVAGVSTVVGVAAATNSDAIATAIKNALNSTGFFACVSATTGAGASAYQVTISFLHNGTLGNQTPVSVTIDSAIGLAATLSTAYLTGGSGTEVLTNILGVAAASEYDLVFCASQDSTNAGLFKAYLDTQYTATVGLPGQGVLCFNGLASANTSTNLSSSNTIAATLNDPVVQWMFSNSPTYAFVIGAGWAARRSVLEGADPTTVETSFNTAVTDISAICKPPSSPSLYMTQTQLVSALNTGTTPVMTTSAGNSIVVRSITSHYQDASNTPDSRTLDTVQVSVPFAYARLVMSDFPQQFGALTLIDNPAPGGNKPASGVTWPNAIKTHYNAIAINLSVQNRPWLTNVAANYANWQFNLDGVVPGRVDATMPVTPVQWVVQFSANIPQLTLY